jgi:GGDEF domain-containing protein
LHLLNEPFWVNDQRIKIGGSVGITLAPTDGNTTDAVLHAADETMYAVKKAGRNNFRFYS